jgi:hypothetical protein
MLYYSECIGEGYMPYISNKIFDIPKGIKNNSIIKFEGEVYNN